MSAVLPTLVIAEIGVNHDGSLDTAKRLMDAAVAAGADAVKLQAFTAAGLATENAPKAKYQETTEVESQLEMLRRLELSAKDFRILLEFARERNVQFMCSPFDNDSLEMLLELGVQTIKIPSGEIVNGPMLRRVGGLGRAVLLSTGMADLGEIEDALEVLVSSGAKLEDITLLHCSTEYPAPFESVNLRAIDTLRRAFGVGVGYSDHTQGIEVAVGAVALGATVIEKHLTLDRSLPGPDHAASIEPEQFAAMVSGIRRVERALGNATKRPSAAELENRRVVRKSVVAARDIVAGEVLTEKNLALKRPGDGLSPMMWWNILGRTASRDYARDEQVEL